MTFARSTKSLSGHREDCEDVIAVDPDAREPEPRSALVERDLLCLDCGVEMPHWLFWQKKTTGALNEAAKMNASLTSPWLMAPSPK